MPCMCAMYGMAAAFADPNGPVDRSEYRFWPQDFVAPPTKVMFLDLNLDLDESRVLVETKSTFSYQPSDDSELTLLRLDASDLKVHEVGVFFDDGTLDKLDNDLAKNDWKKHCNTVDNLSYSFLKDVTSSMGPTTEPLELGLAASTEPGTYVVNLDDNKLLITLPRPVKAGEQFVVRTVTSAIPTNHILEGIYYDYTPEGQPRTLTSQCQQYGFQRIAPTIDQMTTKTCYRTTITGDARYTNLITNGDLAEGFFDPVAAKNGVQIATPKPASEYRFAHITPQPEGERITVQYENWITPMSPYLFFLGAGTFTTYSKTFEYPNGKKFQMELLLFPGQVSSYDAGHKIEIMEHALMNTYLSLGREACQHTETREKVWALLAKRDALLKKQSVVIQANITSITGKPLANTYGEHTDANGKLIFDEKTQIYAGTGEGLTDAETAELASIRAELATLMQEWKETGYEYTGQVYREISQKFSNFGGMENVGNTTIIASAIAPKYVTSDREYVYMSAVCAHEFYHNICGSETTANSPFAIFLNEAMTVQIGERCFCDRVFGEDFMRASQVLYALTPAVGPLAIDVQPGTKPIQPKAMNNSLELITACTYSKAPELCNMLKTLIGGRDNYENAVANYFSRFKHMNASPEDYLAALQEYNHNKEITVQEFAKHWLHRPGHPVVHYSTKYDADTQTYTVSLKQTGFTDGQPWPIPISWAFVKDGKVLNEGLVIMKDETMTISEKVTAQPDFASIARNWSFFGRTVCEDSEDVIVKQALSDPDSICKLLAFRTISDRVRTVMLKSLLAGETPVVPASFIELMGKILFDPSVSLASKTQILTIADTVDDTSLSMHYWGISDVRKVIYAEFIAKYEAEVLRLYEDINQPHTFLASNKQSDHMHERSLKGLLYSMLASAALMNKTKAPLVEMLAKVLRDSYWMTDKSNAISTVIALEADESVPQVLSADYFNNIAVEESIELMAKPVQYTYFDGAKPFFTNTASIHPADKALCLAYTKKHLTAHPDGVSSFFALAATCGVNGVNGILANPLFKIELPDHSRTVCRQWGAMRTKSLLTKEGLAITSALLLKVAAVNEMSATALVQACNDAARFPTEAKNAVVAMLQKSYDELKAMGKISLTKSIDAMIKACK